MKFPPVLPLLPIRNAVIFPGASMPLVVGRPRSIGALKEAQEKGGMIVVAAQRVHSTGDPTPADIYSVGTVCKIDNLVGTDTGGFQIVITGITRYHVADFVPREDHLAVRGETVNDVHGSDATRTRALLNALKELSKEILDLFPGAGESLSRLVDRIDDAGYLTNLCAAYLNVPTQQKQELLEEVFVDLRAEKLLTLMRKEREVLILQRDIQEKMSERLNKAQREAILREQMKTIREELGDEGGQVKEDLGKRVEDAGMPEEVRKVAMDELRRLESLPPAAAEYHVIRTYLEWLSEMPWAKSTRDVIDLKYAGQVLEEDHYGLDQVKKRILQYLAVAKLKNDLRGPILCLVGPPGVGKTSLGQSIARALGRKFIRSSLGGIRDEAEIRGHRRTYIGAMPGRIIQMIRRAGVKNPLFMLDEIDKLAVSFQGDPASALLEVLDPEQNKSFVDHYLDVPFDLSHVFFVATANVTDTIPPALRDRMELIELTGYTTTEKIHIARRYLIPRELREHGLGPAQVEIADDGLFRIITHYTREAGVRELQRQIATVCRACATDIVGGKRPPEEKALIDAVQASAILGPEKFFPEVSEREVRPGVVTGLAWTPHGGDILFIEATHMPGTGKLLLTGQLGEVMKESAQIAVSFARGLAAGRPDLPAFEKNDVHIHVPAGAIPKDGPSAGVAILTAIVSLLTGRTVDAKLGMTGEITLRGAVLPVGGIKEKILAGHRAGLRRILLPKRNQQDLATIPAEVQGELDLGLVDNVEEVLGRALGLGPEELRAVDRGRAA